MGLLDILGGRRGGGMSPITLGLLGLLAYRTLQGKGRLADMLGRPSAGGSPDGGLFGNGAGNMLTGGLSDLLDRFRQAGQTAKADSWVAKGPNEQLSADELEKTLGPERIEWLQQQTGMSREELLAGLSRELPGVVDKLTPEGRIPTQDEASRMV
jgi:uncharacterized protein YidB (DUF937 family)